MLNQWERWVQFHELQLKSEPEDAPQILLKDLLPHWIKRIEDGSSVKLIRNETAAIRIKQIQHDKKNRALIMLLQYSDTNVTDPAFANLKNGDLRVEPKLEGEGVAVSAHLVMSTEPHDKLGEFYKLVLEEVPGLGRSAISPFIRAELKEISPGLFQFKDPDENNKVKNYLPAGEILGKPSKQFAEELEEGSVLQSIELVKFTSSSPEIDEVGFYKEESRHVKLVPDKSILDGMKETLNKVLSFARSEGYDDIKFRYKHPKGKQKTATMGSSMEDVADALVARSESIKAEEVLGQCSEKIVASIAKKMVELLRS